MRRSLRSIELAYLSVTRILKRKVYPHVGEYPKRYASVGPEPEIMAI